MKLSGLKSNQFYQLQTPNWVTLHKSVGFIKNLSLKKQFFFFFGVFFGFFSSPFLHSDYRKPEFGETCIFLKKKKKFFLTCSFLTITYFKLVLIRSPGHCCLHVVHSGKISWFLHNQTFLCRSCWPPPPTVGAILSKWTRPNKLNSTTFLSGSSW